MAQFSRRAIFKILGISLVSTAPGLLAVVKAQTAPATGIFHGAGVLTEVNREKCFVTIDHGEIKGFMAAMIMTYRVAPGAMSQMLREGEQITFDIDAASETIIAMKPVGPAN